MYRSQPNTMRLLSKLCLALVLWAGWISIEHSVDYEPDHHHHHQCELFDLIAQSLQSDVPSLPLVAIGSHHFPETAATPVVFGFISHKARSPPLSTET